MFRLRRYFLIRLSVAVSLFAGAWPNSAQDISASFTEYGYPNFQGYWTNPFQTPLQRPIALGERRAYSIEEAQLLIDRAIALDLVRQAPIDPNRPAPDTGARLNNQADGNFEIMPTELATVDGEIRTSLIVVPDNGRIPWKTCLLYTSPSPRD